MSCPNQPQETRECPVDHSTDKINSLNQMPELSQLPQKSQQTVLSTTRTISTIPKNDSKWEYPSPQVSNLISNSIMHWLEKDGKQKRSISIQWLTFITF